MSNQFVGFENVPNCYITKVVLTSNSTKSFECAIDLEVFDLTETSSVWAYNDFFTNNLKVCLVATSDLEFINRFSSGRVLPSRSLIFKESNSDTTQIITAGVTSFSKVNSDGFEKFKTHKKIRIPNEINNLTLFAFCFLDTVQISAQVSLDLTGQLKNYYGAVTSETVLKSGRIATTSNVFYRPDNSLYVGPVHQHMNTYMVGSRHTSQPHDTLRLAKIRNLKIVDKRQEVFSDRNKRSSTITPVISNLHTSFNNSNDLIGLFFVNMQQVILTKTKLGRSILNLDTGLFNEFLETVTIRSIIVKRARTKFKFSKNKLGTNKLPINNKSNRTQIVAAVVDKGDGLASTENLQEKFLFSNKLLRSFEFTDASKNVNDTANYIYYVDISINDGSQKFVDNLLLNLKRSYGQLVDIIDSLSRNKSFDYKNDRLREDVSMPVEIENIIVSFYSALNYLKEISNEEIKELIIQKSKQFSKSLYKPAEGYRFIAEFSKLINVLSRKLKVSKDFRSTPPKTIKKMFIPARIELHKTFDSVINFSKFRSSYDYIGVNNTKGMMSLSTAEIVARAEFETSRFFNSNTGGTNDNLPKEVADDLSDLESSKFSFFSPVKFTFNEREANLEELNSLQFDLINSGLKASEELRRKSNLYGYGSSLSKSKKEKDLKRYRTSTPKTEPETVEQIMQIETELIESLPYLGENSEFVLEPNLISQAGEIGKEDGGLGDATDTSVDNVFNIVPVASRDDYNPNFGNNIINNLINNKKDLKDTPNVFKSLVNGDLASIKHSVLSGDLDIFKDPVTSNAATMIFTTLQRLDRFAGFSKDSDGVDIVTQPIFEPLTRQHIISGQPQLCRMTYFDDATLGLKVTDAFRLPVRNEMFLVSDVELTRPSSLSAEPLTANLSQESPTIVKYSTTNVVSQPTELPIVTRTIISNTESIVNQRVAASTLPDRGDILTTQTAPTQNINRRQTTPTTQRQQRQVRVSPRRPRTPTGGGY